MGKLTGRVGHNRREFRGQRRHSQGLASEGMMVVVAARRKDRLEQLVTKIEMAGSKARLQM